MRKDNFVRNGGHANVDINDDDGNGSPDIPASSQRTEVRFGVMDLSRRTGGVFLVWDRNQEQLDEGDDDHESHQNGLGVDVRFIRNDNIEGGVGASGLNRARTIELINLFFAHGASRVFISADTEVSIADFSGNTVIFDSGHDDHFHIDFSLANRPSEISLELIERTPEGNYRVRINSRDQYGFRLVAFTVTATGGTVSHRGGTPSSDQLIEAARYEGTSLDDRTFNEDYIIDVYPNQPGEPVTVNVSVYRNYGVSSSITLGSEEGE